ncbi:MAG: hypothetical protein IT532_12615 [Burkholderiales bacterium]|nr:hypothetical protein [Burkholderiales bacterium]
MAIDSTTRELIDDCLSRIANGDASAALDLASTFMSHADSKDIGLNLAVVEALVSLAKTQGSSDAVIFLQDQWPDMQSILKKRWQRAGFV